MKTAQTAATAATNTSPASLPTYEEVEARLRAEYKSFTPELRESLGEEPSKSAILGEWARQQSNQMSHEEIRAAALRVLSRAYGEAATQSHEAATAVRS